MQKRGDKYRVQFRDATGKLKSATFTLRKDASTFEEKMKRERELVSQGMELPKESELLLDYAAKYLRLRTKQGTASTFASEEPHIKRFVNAYGLKPLRSITSKDISSFLDDLLVEENLNPATRNRARAYLNIMLERAFKAGEIMVNPVARTDALKENPAKKVPLENAEVATLIGSTEDLMRKLFFIVLVYQGPRVSEAVGLNHGDFNLKHDFLSLRRIVEQASGEVQDRLKGKAEGIVVPLLPVVRAAYMAYAKTRSKAILKPDEPVFLNVDGTRASTYTGKSWVKTARKHSKITKKLTPHVLRATFASLAEEKGMPREVIQKLMGHSSIAVTQRYITRGDTQIQKAVLESGFGAIAGSKKIVSHKRKRG